MTTMAFEHAYLFGFRFIAAPTVDDVVADMLRWAQQPAAGDTDFVITPNASTIVYYNEPQHKHLKDFYSNAAYILPDGMPVVWLSKLKGATSLPARLTGSDLFPQLWQAIKAQPYPATLVLSNEDLAARYRQDYNKCNTVVPRFFSADDDVYITEFAAATADAIISNDSRFVFLGLNFPKQEKLGIAIGKALKERNYAENCLVLLLGASFEFYFGLKKRAHEFFKKTGLEWLYRFASEPRRLWRRYTVDNVRFLNLVAKELLSGKK